MIVYEDLDLRLHSDGEGFAVHARYGSQSATEPLQISDAIHRELLHIEGATAETIERRGADLFDALIRGSVRDLYQQRRGYSAGNASAGFRLRLIFDPRDARLGRLIDLPWEILRDRNADGNGVPALDARRPVVRTIESMEPVLPVAPEKLQRVLLALADPWESENGLDLDRERGAVVNALRRIYVQPQVLERATRNALFDRISGSNAQVVHFMGHSDVDARTGQGMLFLHATSGNEDDRLAASEFAGFFVGRAAPQLVILTSCLSARRADHHPFAGIAFSLVAAGLPAVIAMQSKVGDEGAIRFTECLYTRLSDGDPVEAAVANARRAVMIALNTTDWAAPVLFVRGGPSAPPVSSPAAVIDSREPQHPTYAMTVVNEANVGHQVNNGFVQHMHNYSKGNGA